MTEPSCLEELPPSLREELLSLGAWIRDGLLQGGQIAFIQCSEKDKSRILMYFWLQERGNQVKYADSKTSLFIMTV